MPYVHELCCTFMLHLLTSTHLVKYVPSSRDVAYLQNLCKCVLWYYSITAQLIYFCVDDLNVPDIEWTSHCIVSHKYPLEINQQTLRMADECYFTQIVIISTPTRNENLLDNFFTNRSSFINYCHLVLVIMKLSWPLSWH